MTPSTDAPAKAPTEYLILQHVEVNGVWEDDDTQKVWVERHITQAPNPEAALITALSAIDPEGILEGGDFAVVATRVFQRKSVKTETPAPVRVIS